MRRGRPEVSSTCELAPTSVTRCESGVPTLPGPGSSSMAWSTIGTVRASLRAAGSASWNATPSKSSSAAARSGRLLSEPTVRATRGVVGQSSTPYCWRRSSAEASSEPPPPTCQVFHAHHGSSAFTGPAPSPTPTTTATPPSASAAAAPAGGPLAAAAVPGGQREDRRDRRQRERARQHAVVRRLDRPAVREPDAQGQQRRHRPPAGDELPGDRRGEGRQGEVEQPDHLGVLAERDRQPGVGGRAQAVGQHRAGVAPGLAVERDVVPDRVPQGHGEQDRHRHQGGDDGGGPAPARPRPRRGQRRQRGHDADARHVGPADALVEAAPGRGEGRQGDDRRRDGPLPRRRAHGHRWRSGPGRGPRGR